MMEEKAKRKAMPVQPFSFLRRFRVLVTGTALLLCFNVLITRHLPLSDLVIFPLLFAQYYAWLLVAGCIVAPLVSLLTITWLKSLYRTWNGLNLTFHLNHLPAVPLIIAPACMIMFGCGMIMFSDSIEVRSSLAYEDRRYFLAKYYGYDDLGYGPHLLYECDAYGILCRSVATYQMWSTGDFITMTVEAHKIKITFEDWQDKENIYFYPSE
jgi:hypothetical protein